MPLPLAGIRTRFTWNEGGELFPLLPPRPWEPSGGTVGGRAVSASGLPVAYLVRTDRLLSLVLRFYETEWPAVRAFLTAGQEQAVLTWFPDPEDPGAPGLPVYLEEPALGEMAEPARLPEYPRVLELPVILRAASSAPWPRYFP